MKQLPVPPLGTSWAGVHVRSVIELTAVPKVGLLPALPCPVHLSSPGWGWAAAAVAAFSCPPVFLMISSFTLCTLAIVPAHHGASHNTT